MFIIDFILGRQIILGMLGAACLFVPWNRRRSYFPLRFLGGAALVLVIIRCIPRFSVPLRLLLYTVLIALWIWACFDCGVIHVMFSATCAYTVQHMTSKLAYMVVQLQAVYGVKSNVNTFLLLLLANVLACVPIFLGFTRRFLNRGQLRFDSAKTVMYSGLFLFVAVFLSYLLESNLDRTSDTFVASYLALNAFCILFAAAILSMEFSNCNTKRLENENMILEQLLESDKRQYEQAKKDMEKINIRYHDLKQQYSQADAAERAKLETEMEALNLRYYTGNKALDIILTQKAAVCGEDDIQFICSVDGSCLAEIKPFHIYSLLGNAIDNAIECLVKVDDLSKRVIRLNICRRGGMAVIRMENYTPAPPVLEDGILISTKQDTSEHGYGMKSIQNISELYGGTADYFVEDEIFYLLVTLPCEEPQGPPAAAAAS